MDEKAINDAINIFNSLSPYEALAIALRGTITIALGADEQDMATVLYQMMDHALYFAEGDKALEDFANAG